MKFRRVADVNRFRCTTRDQPRKGWMSSYLLYGIRPTKLKNRRSAFEINWNISTNKLYYLRSSTTKVFFFVSVTKQFGLYWKRSQRILAIWNRFQVFHVIKRYWNGIYRFKSNSVHFLFGVKLKKLLRILISSCICVFV